MGNARRERRVPLLLCLLGLFFVSGACGLVYQQLWLRELSLVFGVTVHAVATVLAAFFAGLALGSFIAGRYADRTARPLRVYAAIEVLIGVLALLTPAALAAVEWVYVEFARALPDSRALLTLARFVLSFSVLLVPATLLGASLPMIVKSSVSRAGGFEQRVSLLYATNTAGAIVGTVAAGFWLIGRYGVLTSFHLAAVGNIVVGLLALVLSRAVERNGLAPDAGHVPVPELPAATPVPDRVRTAVLITFTISGLVAIALEVVWFRILVLYLDSNTYAFTIMLATVLAGIAIGSYAAAPLMRWIRHTVLLLVVAELSVAITALLSVLFLAETYSVSDAVSGLVGSNEAEGIGFMLVASAVAILPTTLLMGVAFPIGLSAWTGGVDVGRRVGVFYACNVAGGLVGSLVAGFVLVPEMGARRSVVFLAALLLAAALLLVVAGTNPKTRLTLVAASTVIFVALAFVAVPDPYEAALEHRYAGERVLWLDEGPQTTVSVHERSDGTRVMYLDGLEQATSHPDVAGFHRLIGTLPMAIHPDPQRALVVGLGGGVTAGAVSEYPGVDVDIVELSGTVVDGARYFSSVNYDVVDRDNANIRVDDARNYLLVTENRYDVITADLILPEHAGAGKLWSIEYWELARDALTDDGVMLQWVPGHRTQAEYDMVLRSFLKVFPDATLWAGGSMLVGTKTTLSLDRAQYEQKLSLPGASEYLSASNLGSFDALKFHYAAGPKEMNAAVGDGQLLTDNHPRIEYYRSLDVESTPADPEAIRGHVRDVVLSD